MTARASAGKVCVCVCVGGQLGVLTGPSLASWMPSTEGSQKYRQGLVVKTAHQEWRPEPFWLKFGSRVARDRVSAKAPGLSPRRIVRPEPVRAEFC